MTRKKMLTQLKCRLESRLVATAGSTFSKTLPQSDSDESRLENHGYNNNYAGTIVFAEEATEEAVQLRCRQGAVTSSN
jgi:hypothetical protein